MVIMESLMMAPLRQKGEGVFRGLLRGARVRVEEKAHRRKALEPGEARMVELVRQLMLDPRFCSWTSWPPA